MSDANKLTIRMGSTRDHLPPAAVSGPQEVLRPFVNERLNSRLVRALPPGEWKVRWRAALPPSAVLTALLHSGGRTVVVGRNQWFAFDDKGRQLATESCAGEDGQIDPQRSVFYVTNRYSDIAARRLADGHLEYRFRVEGTEDYARTFLHRGGASMVVASSKRASNPMNPAPVLVSALETYEFVEPAKMDDDQLVSVVQRAIQHYEASRLWVAVHGTMIVVAYTNTVGFLDAGLKGMRSLSGSFEPQGMSLDEAGRLHLLVQSGGKQALWLVSPRGEAVAFPLDSPVFHRPPVIGYDHTVYLLGMGHVQAIAESGKLAWSYASRGRVAGAMALPGNRLLVSAGGAVVVLDEKGTAGGVAEFPGESLTLAPVLTASGDLLVATQQRLYCMSR